MMRKFGVLFLTVAGLAQMACITAPRTGAGAKAAHGSRAKGKLVTVDDFETGHAVNDASWTPSADSNNLGSVADFKVEPGDTGGKVGHFYGKLGRNVKPWPWASLSLPIRGDGGPTDFSGVRAIRMKIKGDGKRYNLAVPTASVTDYGTFRYSFFAPLAWKEIEIQVKSLAQPDWAVKVASTFLDATAIDIQPSVAESDFSLYIDDVRFVMDRGGASPFEIKEENQSEVQGTSVMFDNFESRGPINDIAWGAYLDTVNAGTLAYLKVEDSGDPQRAHAAHITGRIGEKFGKWWPWAYLGVGMTRDGKPLDMTAVKAIRFWCKGGGKFFKFQIKRQAVTDFADFGTGFMAPKEWKQITIPLDRLTQPNWAIQVPRGFPDAVIVQFLPPQLAGTNFDFWIDDVEFILEPGKSSPFPQK